MLAHKADPKTSTRTNTIINALKRRAQALLNDTSIDPQSRAIIRYALETHDPWLAELVRRADAGEPIVDTGDFESSSETSGGGYSGEKISALTELICRAGDEPQTKTVALLVLMATIENAAHPKAIANAAKYAALFGAQTRTSATLMTLKSLCWNVGCLMITNICPNRCSAAGAPVA